MTRWARLPIRYRLAITFGASAAVVIAGLSVFVYAQTASGLLTTIDVGLSARAGALATSARDDGPAQVNVEPTLIESTRVFAQIDDASGRVLKSTASIAGSRLLSPPEARSLRRATRYDRTVPGIANVSRVLAVPVMTRHGRLIVAVGASLQDRHNQLAQLAATLAVAGSAALALLTLGAWLALASALRPVERMRRQAADISASDPGRRLSLSPGKDEIALLGATLNQMLDRIEESVANERRLGPVGGGGGHRDGVRRGAAEPGVRAVRAIRRGIRGSPGLGRARPRGREHDCLCPRWPGLGTEPRRGRGAGHHGDDRTPAAGPVTAPAPVRRARCTGAQRSSRIRRAR